MNAEESRAIKLAGRKKRSYFQHLSHKSSVTLVHTARGRRTAAWRIVDYLRGPPQRGYTRGIIVLSELLLFEI